ncbi:MAG: o-succinylbenzoate synthase [Actinomycetales bacterium]|nr:o-succinylbenzoate synthase [Actinomycetales bacterium]
MHPPLSELLATARVVSLPLAVKFRGIWSREIMLFQGPQGWTEFSPFVEYNDDEAVHWLRAAIEFGWQPLPPLYREQIMVNATVPAVAPDQVAEILSHFDGCRTAKVKVGEPGQLLIEDVERVREVRRILGPEGRIRVDANGVWNVDEAEHAFHALAEFDLEYVEQPCASLEELAELRQRTHYMDVPIAADESIRKAEDPRAVAQAVAADVLVLKAQPLGGISKIVELSEEVALPIVLSSALESSVGISMGLYAAAAVKELNFDCGLGTASLLAGDVTEAPLVAQDGAIAVQRPVVSEDLLERFAADPDTTAWWLERLERCYKLL